MTLVGTDLPRSQENLRDHCQTPAWDREVCGGGCGWEVEGQMSGDALGVAG